MRVAPAFAALSFAFAFTGCSAGAASTHALPQSAPIPFLLQYVGEYDGAGHAGIAQLVLHASGAFEATIDGHATEGTFAGASTPGDASVTLYTTDGLTLSASFRAIVAPWPVPAQSVVDVVRPGGATETLIAPWVAGDETMCSATDGSWHDDDADAKTGLYCTCRETAVFMPSRGGCVAAGASGSDPARLPISDGARQRAGEYDGSSRVGSIVLAADGSYQATIDRQPEHGSWWDGAFSDPKSPDVSIRCTSALHAFAATLRDGTMTVQWASGPGETLSAAAGSAR
jgi:hypothetical protein